MEPRIAELLVRGGIVSRDQLIQAQEKERDNGSSVIRELVRLEFYYRRYPYRVSCQAVQY